MNIVFYKKRIQKYKKLLESGKSKYSEKRLKNWILGCKIKIEKLKKNRPQTKRPFRRK